MKKKVMGVAGLAAMGFAAFSSVAGAVTVGPGDGIVSPVRDGGNYGASGCSISHAGTVTDKDGGNPRKVAFTAGHCGEPGDEVYLRSAGGQAEKIGTIGHDNDEYEDGEINSSDYGVIYLDEGVETTGTSQSQAMFPIIPHLPKQLSEGYVASPTNTGDALQFDNFGRPVARDGATTGRQYGIQLARTEKSTLMIVPVAPGDSGGSVYDPITREHIGTVSRGNPVFFLLIASNSDKDVKDFEEAYGVTYVRDTSTRAHTKQNPHQTNMPDVDWSKVRDVNDPGVPNFAPLEDVGSMIPAAPELPALPEVPSMPAAPAMPAADYAALTEQANLGVNTAADTAVDMLDQARAYAPVESAPFVDGAVDSVNTARDAALAAIG